MLTTPYAESTVVRLNPITFAAAPNLYSIIRPVQAVLRHVPERRRSRIEILLVPPQRKVSAKVSAGTVAVAADHAQKPGRNGDESCDSNRLASIMRFLPLREAFGEFCRRSLCSEVSTRAYLERRRTLGSSMLFSSKNVPRL